MRNHLLIAAILISFLPLHRLSASSHQNKDTFEPSDLIPEKELAAQGIKKINENLKVNLPSNFSINQTGGLFFKRFSLNRTDHDAGTRGGFDGMGSSLSGGFFRYSHYWWQNSKGELIAQSSIRFFRTARVFDNHGDYLGKIHKKYFTWFSGRPEINIYNKHDELVAQLKLEEEVSEQKKYFIMQYVKTDREHTSDNYGNTIATLKFRKSKDSKNDLWGLEIFADAEEKFFNENDIDPRLIPFIPVYISYWEQINRLDH